MIQYNFELNFHYSCPQLSEMHNKSMQKTQFSSEWVLKALTETTKVCCVNLRQLHAHEHSGHEEAEQDTDEPNEEQQEAVQFGNVGSVGAIQDYKSQTSHCEEETGGQSFHNILPIYSEKEKKKQIN